MPCRRWVSNVLTDILLSLHFGSALDQLGLILQDLVGMHIHPLGQLHQRLVALDGS